MNEVMQSWVGRNANDLVAVWETPDRVNERRIWGRIFVYDYSFTHVSTGSSHVVGNTIIHNPSNA